MADLKKYTETAITERDLVIAEVKKIENCLVENPDNGIACFTRAADNIHTHSQAAKNASLAAIESADILSASDAIGAALYTDLLERGMQATNLTIFLSDFLQKLE